MEAKQIDVKINFYEDSSGIQQIAKAIPINCELEKHFPDAALGYCDKRKHWQNEMVDGCCHCRGINIWTNKCLCIYNPAEHQKTIKEEKQ